MVLKTQPYHRVDPETAHERIIIGAFALAMFLHLVAAISFGWISIPTLALPVEDNRAQPFTVHQVTIPPDVYKSLGSNPIDEPPPTTSSSTTSQLELNPELLTKPHPLPSNSSLTAPMVDVNQVISSTSPLKAGLPLRTSDTAKLSTQIIQYQEGPSNGANLVSPSTMADMLVHERATQTDATTPSSTHAGGNGKTGDLPGFAQVIDTVKPPPVDTSNLPKPEVVRMPADVLFAFDQSILLPAATPILQKAADMITKFPQANVQVDGYSDSIGEAPYNQKLSDLRAQAVQEWLVAHVPPGNYNFKANGHGSSNFVVDPSGAKEQQAENRRVELLIQALKL